MIEVGYIVTLENNQEYLLLEELIENDKKYLYAVRTLQDDVPTDEFLIFEAQVTEEGEFLQVVSEPVLYNQLLDKFKDVVADKVLNGELDDMQEVSE